MSGSDSPIFVVGCGRSGTTLLRLMLDSHPGLAVPGESHFIPPLWAYRRHYESRGKLDPRGLARDIMDTPHFKLWGIPEETVRRRVDALDAPHFADVVEAVFLAYADHHGKTRWGDKTPIYVLSLPLLSGLFPRARFVHLIRDGRDVALSYLSVPWGPTTIWQAAHKWRRDVTGGRRDGRALGTAKYVEVRYEELVLSPREVLKRVCAFAGLGFAEEMLDYHRDAMARIQSPADGTKFHASASRPLATGLRDWHSQMPEADVMAFEAVAGDLLSELGYERRFPTVSFPWRLRGNVRVRALGLRATGSTAKKALMRKMTGRPPAGIGRLTRAPSMEPDDRPKV